MDCCVLRKSPTGAWVARSCLFAQTRGSRPLKVASSAWWTMYLGNLVPVLGLERPVALRAMALVRQLGRQHLIVVVYDWI